MSDAAPHKHAASDEFPRRLMQGASYREWQGLAREGKPGLEVIPQALIGGVALA